MREGSLSCYIFFAPHIDRRGGGGVVEEGRMEEGVSATRSRC